MEFALLPASLPVAPGVMVLVVPRLSPTVPAFPEDGGAAGAAVCADTALDPITKTEASNAVIFMLIMSISRVDAWPIPERALFHDSVPCRTFVRVRTEKKSRPVCSQGGKVSA
jgi:hypothetical protein